MPSAKSDAFKQHGGLFGVLVASAARHRFGLVAITSLFPKPESKQSAAAASLPGELQIRS
ncbi:MAG: hypothetical protein H0T77_13935 [Pyrinomonadaceae bacterium]|nr:hypothetical protein [Pyrinomonadaceae bacterium]